jgi:hypothetical protein
LLASLRTFFQKKTEKKGKKKEKESRLKRVARQGCQGFCNKKYYP